MYTELILGCSLKKDTPNHVIDTLKFMLNELDDAPPEYPFDDGRYEYMLTMSSYYFGVSSSHNNFYYDDIGKKYIISTRSNLKNYDNEIQTFLNWLEPYIESGSGNRDMYAVVTYEDGEPQLYYKNDEL